MNKRIVVLLFIALLMDSTLAWSHVELQGFTVTSSGPVDGLFTSVGAQGAPNVQYTDAVWPVTVDLALLSTLPSSVVVNFPDRAWVTLTRMRAQPRGPNGFIWTGRGGDCSAFLREAPGGFKGQIGCHNAGYEVSAVPTGSGLQLVRTIAPPGETESDVVATPPILPISQPQQLAPATQVDSSIDILVLYTAAVRVAMDGTGGGDVQTQLLAQDAVDQTQMVMDNSVPTGDPPLAQVNLVSAQEVLRTTTGDFSADLFYLETNSEATPLRNFWAADVVMYLTVSGTPNYSGLSNQPDYVPLYPPGPDFAPYAGSALLYNCALMVTGPGQPCYDTTVFPHEFGHNLGADHDTQNSPWPMPTYPPYPTSPPMPVEPYAFGHYGNTLSTHDGYHTVMSYLVSSGCNAPCPRVPYYSNPAVTTPDGFKTGVAGTQNNAAVIQMFAPATAQYRLSLGRIFYNGFEGVQ